VCSGVGAAAVADCDDFARSEIAKCSRARARRVTDVFFIRAIDSWHTLRCMLGGVSTSAVAPLLQHCLATVTMFAPAVLSFETSMQEISAVLVVTDCCRPFFGGTEACTMFQGTAPDDFLPHHQQLPLLPRADDNNVLDDNVLGPSRTRRHTLTPVTLHDKIGIDCVTVAAQQTNMTLIRSIKATCRNRGNADW
jgi:hypothetical protein